MIYVQKYDRHINIWYEMNRISSQNTLNKSYKQHHEDKNIGCVYGLQQNDMKIQLVSKCLAQKALKTKT